MIKLHSDILEVYNALTVYSKDTLEGLPLKVSYSPSLRAVIFEQMGKQVVTQIPLYYCRGLDKIGTTWLTSEDYDNLMYNLKEVIESGKMTDERVCVTTEKYGFSIWCSDPKRMTEGPKLIGGVRFVSSCNPIFKWYMNWKSKQSNK